MGNVDLIQLPNLNYYKMLQVYGSSPAFSSKLYVIPSGGNTPNDPAYSSLITYSGSISTSDTGTYCTFKSIPYFSNSDTLFGGGSTSYIKATTTPNFYADRITVGDYEISDSVLNLPPVIYVLYSGTLSSGSTLSIHTSSVRTYGQIYRYDPATYSFSSDSSLESYYNMTNLYTHVGCLGLKISTSSSAVTSSFAYNFYPIGYTANGLLYVSYYTTTSSSVYVYAFEAFALKEYVLSVDGTTYGLNTTNEKGSVPSIEASYTQNVSSNVNISTYSGTTVTTDLSDTLNETSYPIGIGLCKTSNTSSSYCGLTGFFPNNLNMTSYVYRVGTYSNSYTGQFVPSVVRLNIQ